MAELQVLGIKITVDDADVAKLQNSLKQSGVETQSLAGQTDGLTTSTTKASAAAVEHAATQTSLHEELGTSRRETMFLEQSLLQITGTSGIAAHGFEALATGIGPVGIAAVLVAGSLELYKSAVDAATKSEIAAAEAATAYGKSRGVAQKQEEVAGLKVYSDEMDRLAKQIGNLEMGLASSDKRTRDFAASQAAAAGGLDYLKSRLIDVTQAYDLLKNMGGQATVELNMYSEANTNAASSNQNMISSTTDEAGMIKFLGTEADITAAKLRELGNVANVAAKEGPNVVAMDKFIADEKVKAMIDAGNKAKAQTDRANAQALADAKKNNDDMAKFAQEGAAIMAEAGAKGAAAYQMIANSALTATEKVAALKMWESTLPADIRQKIQIYLAVNGDALLMRLLGGGGGGGGTGNQQGNEFGFTLEGESFAVRDAYMRQYGDYGRANNAWQAQHRADLLAQGKTPPPPTADGGIVNSPQVRQVGEAGPEAIIPLSQLPAIVRSIAGAMGGNQGGGVQTINHMTFNVNSAPGAKSIMQDLAILRAQAGI